MKKLLFFANLLLFILCVFSSCKKEDESEVLFNKLEVVEEYPSNGVTVDMYLFNDVYVIFNRDIVYENTVERVVRCIRVYNRTTNNDITKDIYITHDPKSDLKRINIKQMFTYLPNCEYEVVIDLPKKKYSFHFHTQFP